jgi:hypothetical protein
MARTKKIARAIDEVEVAAGEVSFDFKVSRVTPKDLEDYAKYKWFSRGAARHCEGESVPQTHADEVVFYMSFLC